MMEIVIKISEKTFKNYVTLANKGEQIGNLERIILNGTPLPKGHGRLKDIDELYSIFKENCDAYNINNLSFISEMDMNFDLAPTIIEADKKVLKDNKQ